MKVLFDTNIVLDVLLERKPFAKDAVQLFAYVECQTLAGYLGGTTITTVYYLAQKIIGATGAKDEIRKLFKLFEIASVDRTVLEAAMNADFVDFEDAVIYESAKQAGVEAIVTRDIKGFKNATLPIYASHELVEKLSQERSLPF